MLNDINIIKNIEKYWNIKNIYIHSLFKNYLWYKYSKKVKNNEDSKNMHIFIEDYS